MTVTEALKLIRSRPQKGKPFDVLLAFGGTPLHVQNFLNAYLQQLLPSHQVRIRSGLYGNLAGTLESMPDEPPVHALAVIIEWSDLDPRLGFREGASWGPQALADVLSNARAMLERIQHALFRLPAGMRIAVCPPTLPLPPAFGPPGWQLSEAETMLDEMWASTLTRLQSKPEILLLNFRRLGECSPPGARYDLGSDLRSGLPYSVPHADAVAGLLAKLCIPATPKKGLITDLDDTLWFGIVGEVGTDGVSWDLTSHHHLHGLYQKLLAGLSERGVLIGVASKNDPITVQKAFDRADLYLKPQQVFPIEAHWEAKSVSVARILRIWNISADAVVFVDDSPMELAEVAARHPGIQCIQFPRDDYAAGYQMLLRLQDLYGKERLSAEDGLRLDSIRKGAAYQQELAEGASAPELFLQSAQAVLGFDFFHAAEDGRVLELVNKTNQFNLNGVRYNDAEWRLWITQPDSILVAVSYADRFGSLGRIAVLGGRKTGRKLSINVWVMSCRAFARRIEYSCLRVLFEREDVAEIELGMKPTSRNGPLQSFLAAATGIEPDGPITLTREQFERTCPPLYHEIVEEESKEWMNSEIV